MPPPVLATPLVSSDFMKTLSSIPNKRGFIKDGFFEYC